MNRIATVSLARPLPDIAGELGDSFTRFGFAVVCDHGIDGELVSRARALTRQLFAMPDEEKRRWHVPGGGGARGYTPFGLERARDARLHDLKEFWHIGRDLPAGHPLAEYMPPNVWPHGIAGFRETLGDLFAAFELTGSRLLRAIALHLGLAEDFFVSATEDGNSVLRLLHYPPLPPDAPKGAVRAAPHGDINTITLLLGAEEAGLELLTREGEWLAIEPPPGALVVNIGDMMDRLTGGRLRSTTHRVVNPVGEAALRSRYSMPFFLHFRPDFVIRPLFDGHDAPPITAHDFLMQRLREINLA